MDGTDEGHLDLSMEAVDEGSMSQRRVQSRVCMAKGGHGGRS